MNDSQMEATPENILDIGWLRWRETHWLDQAQACLWPSVEAGNGSAIGMYLKISERRSDLLGLDGGAKTPALVTGELPPVRRADYRAAIAPLKPATGESGHDDGD